MGLKRPGVLFIVPQWLRLLSVVSMSCKPGKQTLDFGGDNGGTSRGS